VTVELPDSSGQRRARLRAIGVLVLLLGLGGAGAVYWTGAAPSDLSDDPSTARAYKTESRDTEINFGKMGLLLNDWMDDLKRPGTQAALIAITSILISAGCFYFARWPEQDGGPGDPAARNASVK
jgi:hypothetical protein